MRRSTRIGLEVLALLFLMSASACGGNFNPSQPPSETVNGSPTDETGAPLLTPPNGAPISEVDQISTIQARQNRYPLKDTHTKLVDNSGNGFAALYGVRNFRAVLNGVVYRGGANNTSNKYGKRSNNNPLPDIGLTNLCKENFGTAIYLYPTNYKTAKHEIDCTSNLDSSKAHLSYKQFNPTTTSGQKAILDAVYKAIQNPASGPVYMHCWNGWHASGLASAIVLRQFCGMDGATAVKYWDLNTDGAPVDSSYTSIRERIRTFVPKAGYEISDEVKSEICPTTTALDL